MRRTESKSFLLYSNTSSWQQCLIGKVSLLFRSCICLDLMICCLFKCAPASAWFVQPLFLEILQVYYFCSLPCCNIQCSLPSLISSTISDILVDQWPIFWTCNALGAGCSISIKNSIIQHLLIQIFSIVLINNEVKKFVSTPPSFFFLFVYNSSP